MREIHPSASHSPSFPLSLSFRLAAADTALVFVLNIVLFQIIYKYYALKKITWINKLAPVFFFGGSARLLKNGNIEFDECFSTPQPTRNAAIYEVAQTTPPQTVWSMQIAGQYPYRGFRIPSLYPGVQW
jgi:hypothetical protein